MIVIKQPVRRAMAVAVVALVGWAPLAYLCCRAAYVHSDRFVRDHEALVATAVGMPARIGSISYDGQTPLPYLLTDVALLNPASRRPVFQARTVRADGLDRVAHLEVTGFAFTAASLASSLDAVDSLLRRLFLSRTASRLEVVGDAKGTWAVADQAVAIEGLRLTARWPSPGVARIAATTPGGAPDPIQITLTPGAAHERGQRITIDSGRGDLPTGLVRLAVPIDEWCGSACRIGGRVTSVMGPWGPRWRFAGRLTGLDLGRLARRLLGAPTGSLLGRDAEATVEELVLGPNGIEKLAGVLTAKDGTVGAALLRRLVDEHRFLLRQAASGGGTVPFYELRVQLELADQRLLVTGRCPAESGENVVLLGPEQPILSGPGAPIRLAVTTADAPSVGPDVSPWLLGSWLVRPLDALEPPSLAPLWSLLTVGGAVEALFSDETLFRLRYQRPIATHKATVPPGEAAPRKTPSPKPRVGASAAPAPATRPTSQPTPK